jgi:ATP-dependent Zn protease
MMVPNEEMIVSTLLMGCSCYIFNKLFQLMKDQHSTNTKQAKDLEGKQEIKTFMDIGGCEKAKKAMREIIDYIRHPESYKKMGVKMPKGIILHGPPGTGKTLFAKAAAAEAGIPVMFASGSEFVELYVGLGAKRVRDMFK